MAKSYFNQYAPRLELPSYDPSMNGNRANGLQELQMGFGEKSFRGDRQGIWLGADSFVDAPFSVDMQGRMILKAVGSGGAYILLDATNQRIVVHDGTNPRAVIGKL